MTPLEDIERAVRNASTKTYVGRVTRVAGSIVEGFLPNARIGALCRLEPPGRDAVPAEVVGLRDERALLMPLGPLRGLSIGTRLVSTNSDHAIAVGDSVLGRVLDGLGEPIDGRGPLSDAAPYAASSAPLNPLTRRAIDTPLDVGVRAINGLLTLAEGQRMAILANAGVGKSTLIGLMARQADADVAVVALIGERGREVKELVEDELHLEESTGSWRRVPIVVVAATADEPPALRLRAGFTATAIAEYFRDRGKRVLLIMDSLSRAVLAQREIALSVGEPPATRGFPPSALAVIPRLLERVGRTEHGSITGIYTTLVEGEHTDDPVAEAVRATSDGHIVLSRALAGRGHYPAIDVGNSISRLMHQLVSAEHLAAARELRTLLSDLEAAEDLMSLGAYRAGSNPAYDRALALSGPMRDYLRQVPEVSVDLKAAVGELRALLSRQPVAQAQRPELGNTGGRRAVAARAEARRYPRQAS